MKIKSSMGIVSIPIPSPFPSLHPSCLRSKERARSVDPSASSPSSLPSSPALSDFFREANFFPAIFRIFEGKSDKGSIFLYRSRDCSLFLERGGGIRKYQLAEDCQGA